MEMALETYSNGMGFSDTGRLKISFLDEVGFPEVDCLHSTQRTVDGVEGGNHSRCLPWQGHRLLRTL